MAKRAGWEVKVKVNDTAFRVKRVERDDTCADLEVGDSEDGVFETHLGGRRVCRITMENATFDDTDNPFATPFALSAGNRAKIEIFWSGTAGDQDIFLDTLITSGKLAADVTALIPASFTAVSSGAYDLAGE